MTVTQVHLVDDDDAVRLSMSLALKSAGYEVVEYESAAQILDAVDVSLSGCVIVDRGLPILNGLQLVDELANIGVLLPTILISGSGSPPSSELDSRPNIIGCLSKPFRLRSLTALIDSD